MKVITMSIIKGGTGKTATASAIAQAGAINGKRVLAVDLDPQANLTLALGADLNVPGAFHIFDESGIPVSDLIQDTPQHISVIASHRNLSTVKTTPGSASRLREALEPLNSDYDLCVIDTPPTLGELVYNALNAADGLIIPLETDINSIQGLYQIVDIAKHIAQRSNPDLKVLGSILTRYDSRPKLNRHLYNVIAEKGSAVGVPLLTAVRSGIVVREAAAFQANLFNYAGKSKPAADYMKLYNMIMEG